MGKKAVTEAPEAIGAMLAEVQNIVTRLKVLRECTALAPAADGLDRGGQVQHWQAEARRLKLLLKPASDLGELADRLSRAAQACYDRGSGLSCAAWQRGLDVQAEQDKALSEVAGVRTAEASRAAAVEELRRKYAALKEVAPDVAAEVARP